MTAAAAATATRPAVGTSRSPAGKRKRGGGSGGGGAAAAAAAAAAAGALAAAASAAELAAPGPPAVLAPAEGLDQQAAKRGLPIGSRARAPAPARARKQQEARARQQTLMQQRLSELGGEEDYSNGSPLPSRGAAPAPVASATHDGVHPWSPTSPEDAPPQLALGLNTLVLDPKLMNTTADSSDAAQPAPASVSPLDGGVLHGEPVSVSPLGAGAQPPRGRGLGGERLDVCIPWRWRPGRPETGALSGQRPLADGCFADVLLRALRDASPAAGLGRTPRPPPPPSPPPPHLPPSLLHPRGERVPSCAGC